MFKGDEGKSPNQSRDDGATIDVERSIQAFCSACLKPQCRSDSITSEASPCLSAHARPSKTYAKSRRTRATQRRSQIQPRNASPLD
ncbi:hypothetical protein CGCF415_v012249 [Colletotrichum fructicola]|nr:hypothetical protein CGCF415_v012249 [Colletotrichum fructicola]KAF4894733.1 hypothetical protein CGCFRS4_v006319 [Colletotrichum fructicola]KAF4925498.1 hypothetical protein CGCF245_v014050 [Colletotrichum fructicola]